MNVKAIPSVDKSHIEGKNVLQLAILSRIKLFVRPANLPQTPGADLAEIFPCRQPSQDNQPICLLPHAGQYQRGREKD